MTVRDLIKSLEDFDPDKKVVVTLIQRYGCEFTYEPKVRECMTHFFDSVEDTEPTVCLIADADEDGETGVVTDDALGEDEEW